MNTLISVGFIINTKVKEINSLQDLAEAQDVIPTFYAGSAGVLYFKVCISMSCNT